MGESENRSTLGCVVIGRNEGTRLEACLNSLMKDIGLLVYVDSGSTDSSVEYSRQQGVEVLELDMSIPFTAARARNEGFAYLRSHYELNYVQFVDADCEILPGWITAAIEFFDANPQVAAVCGGLRECYPEESIYNKLCDIEWDLPEGESSTCGGNAMFRTQAFNAVDGFKSDLIAGEEPELCFRLREQGWKIFRLKNDMALHDASMKRFAQWWRRSLRAGYAFAQGAWLHGDSPERFWVRESRRALVWGLLVPFVVFALTLSLGFWALGLLIIYPIQVLRTALRGSRSKKENWLYALFVVIAKFPEAFGQIRFHLNRLLDRRISSIDHK